MTPTVFLLAAGKSKRFNYYPKQILEFRGEQIMRRTVRMIREINPDIPVYIVTWRDELKYNDVLIIDTKKATPSVSATILFTEPYWDNINIFLASDTIFYPDSLKQILNLDRYCVIGKLYDPKGWSERFGVVIPKKDRDKGMEMCARAYNNEGLRAFVAANRPLLYWKAPWYFRNIKDYIFYHMLPRSKMTLTGDKHVEISDDTSDIDSYDEYLTYIENHR